MKNSTQIIIKNKKSERSLLIMNNNKIIYLFFLLLILFLLVIGGCTSETVVEEYDISGIIIDQNGEKLKNYTDITIYIHGDEIEKTVYPADNGSWTSTV